MMTEVNNIIPYLLISIPEKWDGPTIAMVQLLKNFCILIFTSSIMSDP